MRPVQRLGACFGAALLIMYATSGRAAESIAVGQLVAQTGPTSQVAAAYGQGVADALKYIDAHGGVGGKKIALETVDYGYDPARAIETYKRWKDTVKPVAIHGEPLMRKRSSIT